MKSPLQSAFAAHDRALAERKLDIWIGGEPTYTDRHSSDPCWNVAALGDDKRLRGARVAGAIARGRAGSVLLRPLGRQYPEEEVPRWWYSIYAFRSGEGVWSGPPDPLLENVASSGGDVTDDIVQRVADLFSARRGGRRFHCASSLPHRFVVTPSGASLDMEDSRLFRPPCGSEKTPPDGPRDLLAEEGCFLVCFGIKEGALAVELPSLSEVDEFVSWLRDLEVVLLEVGISSIIIGGFPPPVDNRIWMTSVTPDPGVLEINAAPESSLESFYSSLGEITRAAESEGLSTEKFFFNGDRSESGGGGHITLGGPSELDSPFLQEPRLLPRMLAFFNRHPSLSYAFAPDGVGSSGQFPRSDESTREALDELSLTVRQLGLHPQADPETLWRSFAPLLADRFGNTHRSEINIEKLWNPHLPLRGKLGLVEMRAMRMQPSAERGAAVASLLRALCAMCSIHDVDLELVDWGRELHDRFALPTVLAADLEVVFAELDGIGLGLGHEICNELRRAQDRSLATIDLGTNTLRLSQALEYWPLISDLSQEQQSSRLVDSSGGRLELSIEGPQADEWKVAVEGYWAPMFIVMRRQCTGIRYRRFLPSPGLHPQIPARDPLSIDLFGPNGARKRVLLHSWRPEGGAYEGYPKDEADASERLAERIVIVSNPQVEPPRAPPSYSTTECTIDTRRLFDR